MLQPVDRFRIVPASYVIFLRGIESDREVLLQLRQGTGYRDGHWATAAAGHIEDGESAFAAAHREVAEELGITEVDIDPLTAMHRTAGNGQAIDERADYFFTARQWQGEPRIIEPEKCADLRWFRLDALPEPVVPHELSVFEMIRAGAVPPIVVHGFPGPQA